MLTGKHVSSLVDELSSRTILIDILKDGSGGSTMASHSGARQRGREVQIGSDTGHYPYLAPHPQCSCGSIRDRTTQADPPIRQEILADVANDDILWRLLSTQLLTLSPWDWGSTRLSTCRATRPAARGMFSAMPFKGRFSSVLSHTVDRLASST